MKHTPGPWVLHQSPPTTEPNWFYVTIDSKLPVIANVCVEPGNARQRADAALIVAAPDLLAACEAALEDRLLQEELSAIGARARESRYHTAESIQIDNRRKAEILARRNEIGRVIRAAIAKAEGGGQ